MKYKNVFKIAIVLLVISCKSFAQCSDFITIDGQKLKCGSNDFFAVVANYFMEVTRGPGANTNNYTYPNFYPSRSHSYFPNNTFSPNVYNYANANAAMRKDFAAIKAKGFNTIRVYGGAQYNPNIETTDWMGNNAINIPFTNSLYDQLLLDVTAVTLKAASDEGLKVIVLTCGKSEMGDDSPGNSVYQAGYVNYLNKFGKRFANEPALLAVDFFNEPTVSGNAYWTKTHACQKVKEWNDALKSNSQILSTIGFWEVSSTFFWDPNMLNIDFASLHNYPFSKRAGNTTTAADAINRMKSDYWWYKNNVKLPWIVGETGLTAHPMNTTSFSSYYDQNESGGTIQEQVDFLHETLNAARDFGATGYSWWEFSDDSPNNYSGGNAGPFWGLIQSNDGASTGSPFVWKPAAQEITNFNPTTLGTASQPANYYNYSNAPYTGNYANGIVRLAGTTTPVKDAIAEIKYNVPGNAITQYANTYTDANGDFTYNLPTGSLIQEIRVTATECDVVSYASSFGPGVFYYLTKAQRPTINTLTYVNNSVTSVNVSSYAITNTNFNNYQIQSSDFKATAGSYINLQAGFVATSNTNFNAHIGPYYFDCATFVFRKNTHEEVDAPAELKDVKVTETFVDRVYPNPGAGIYHIETAKEGEYQVEIFNVYGALVKTYSFNNHKGEIHLENESSGVYLFTLKDKEKNIQYFKIVKE
ncbi:MAG: T9SS type A sorting domain-containing protein [Bacteroidota bacterium]